MSAGLVGHGRAPAATDAQSNTRIVVLSSDEASLVWSDLSLAIKKAFEGASFCPGFGPDSPLDHSREGMRGRDKRVYRHVVARDRSYEILGACFRVPVEGVDGEHRDADPGWFFTTPALRPLTRVHTADMIIRQTHRLMKDAGFTRVVTNMGTHAGAAYLKRRWGYVHAPSDTVINRWVKQL